MLQRDRRFFLVAARMAQNGGDGDFPVCVSSGGDHGAVVSVGPGERALLAERPELLRRPDAGGGQYAVVRPAFLRGHSGLRNSDGIDGRMRRLVGVALVVFPDSGMLLRVADSDCRGLLAAGRPEMLTK